MGVSTEIRFRCDSVADPTRNDPWGAECDRETWSNGDSRLSVTDAVESARKLGWAISRMKGRWRVRCPRHLGRNGLDSGFIEALDIGH